MHLDMISKISVSYIRTKIVEFISKPPFDQQSSIRKYLTFQQDFWLQI